LADLTEIRGFIARDSDAYAAAFAERVLASVDRLADVPAIGQRVIEIDDDAIRELIVDRYRVIYRVRNQAVDLAAIIHGARDLPAVLANRGLTA
jgi:toxin ParE1/3/4